MLVLYMCHCGNPNALALTLTPQSQCGGGFKQHTRSNPYLADLSGASGRHRRRASSPSGASAHLPQRRVVSRRASPQRLVGEPPRIFPEYVADADLLVYCRASSPGM